MSKVQDKINEFVKQFHDWKKFPSDKEISQLASEWMERDYTKNDAEGFVFHRAIVAGMTLMRNIIENNANLYNTLYPKPQMDEKLFLFLKEKFVGSRWEINYYSGIGNLVKNPEIDGFPIDEGEYIDYDDSYVNIDDKQTPPMRPGGITNTMVDFEAPAFNINTLFDVLENHCKDEKTEGYKEFYDFVMALIMEYK